MAKSKAPRAAAPRPARSRRVPAGTITDAADLAAAKATLAALPEAAVLTSDRWSGGGADIVFANEQFATLTGYPAGVLAGRNTRILHGPRTEGFAPRGAGAAPIAHQLRGASWLYRQDGSEFHGEWNFAPFLPGLLVGVYRDTTATQRLEQGLYHAQQLDTVGQLASSVAHDLNNLLSIINGYCEILAGKLAAEAAEPRRDLDQIHRAAVKASTLARQILEFSRRQDSEPRVVNPNTLIREIAEMLRRAMGEAVQVELRLASDLGNTRIDPTRLQQVLFNLCFNARDAMSAGGKLTVRTANHGQRTDEPGLPAGGYVVLQVTDTGTGFDETVRARLFEPFFTTKTHGTGLGLSTALGIIRHADGCIRVHSKPGTGTTFEIFLPETAEPEHSTGAPLPPLPSTRGTEHLWLVETDTIVRKMVSGILTVDGYRVRELASMDEALTASDSEPAPDLALMDCGAAGAARLAHRLLGLNPRLKILAVSIKSPASALPDVSPLAIGHLPKPFALSTLLRAVRNLLDSSAR